MLPYQFVLQDHNYGAPPPPTPPLSPVPPIVQGSSSRSLVHHYHHHGSVQPIPPPLTAQDLSGMAALATVADQVRAGSTSLSLLLQAEDDSRGSPLSSDEHEDPGPEGEETETAAEGEGDEDSVTRCICDFEHDDGYMICCDKCCVWQHVDCMGIDRSNIPDEYLCELCRPRRVDRARARNLQLRKMHNDTSSSDDDQPPPPRLSTATTAATAQSRRLSTAGSAKKRQAKRETKKVVKRQRRDSAAVAAREQRVSERRASKKRELLNSASNNILPSSPNKTESKRIGTRRRSKNKQADSMDEDTQEAWADSNHSAGSGHQSPGATPAFVPQQPQLLRQWIDNYEEAVTNHYSPELRARISSIKVNGIHSDFKVSNYTSQKCRTSMLENGVKVLISTAPLHANQPIIEIRGKYMLASQQQQARGSGTGRGAAATASSPYLLFYTLPKEGADVCIDARTYGNDARFVRSSCKPNAEVRHCIEKGALHLYLVACQNVDKHAEITIKHEDTGPRSYCKDCPLYNNHTGPTPRNGLLQDSSVDRRVERRRRGSRRTVSSEEGITAVATTALPEALVVNSTMSSSNSEVAPPPPVPTPVVTTSPTTTSVALVTAPPTPPAPPVQAIVTPVSRRGPKSPTKVTPTTPVTPAPTTPASEDSNDGVSAQEERDIPASPDKRKMTREERKMEAIMKAFERMEKAEQRRQETLARQQQQRQRSSIDSHDNEDLEQQDNEAIIRRPKGRRTRGRSSSGASSHAASADEGFTGVQRQLSPAPNNSVSPRILASPPPVPSQPITLDKTASVVLTNCMSFKFPKTKKVLMNEWLSKPSAEPPVSPVKLELGEEIIGRTGAAAAKKRWLRQAISEESEPIQQCNSPNRPGSPPGGDYVTPLKKRRLARESLSSEQSFTPPTTPASDKEEAHSPEQEEASVPIVEPTLQQSREELAPPPAPIFQMHNAARCIEEAVKVLSADSGFLERIMVGKTPEVKNNIKDLLESPVKCCESSPVKVEVKEEFDLKNVKLEEPRVSDGLTAVKEEKIEAERQPSPVQQEQGSVAPPPPPPSSNTPPSLTLTPTIPPPPAVIEPKEILTPASIKRKLSISEYRQRKRAEEEKGGESCDGLGTPSPTSQDEEREQSAASSPSDPSFEHTDKLDGSLPAVGSMRWSSEPTLVERQRENLTERLKREFGLFLDDQDPNKAAAVASALLTTASKKQAGLPTTAPTGTPAAVTTTGILGPNNCTLLPPLPPLEPPSVKCTDPHNIPLPPCSPPPLHDLLSEPPLPPSAEDEKSSLSVGTSLSKSAKPPPNSILAPGMLQTSSLSPAILLQNGPTKLSSQSKSLIGGVQNKNQILSSQLLNNSTVRLTNKCSKKPIPTSTPSLQNTSIRPASSTATTT